MGGEDNVNSTKTPITSDIVNKRYNIAVQTEEPCKYISYFKF